MSDLSVAATSSTLTQPKDAVGKKSLGKEDFMKLFITELQYQDPSKPMDSNEMASQLAQFSSMEATVKMSDNMEKLLASQTSTSNMQLLTMLNSKVQTAGNTIAVSGGKVSPSEFTLKLPAGSAVIEIRDINEALVWQQDNGALSQGAYGMSWDGKDLNGKAVPDGAYHYEVKGAQTDGSSLEVSYQTTATVTGVKFENGAAQLTLDKYITAGLADVTSVLANGSGNGNSVPAAAPAGWPAAGAGPVTRAGRSPGSGHGSGPDAGPAGAGEG